MLTLIHGDDTAASRKLFLSHKETDPDAVLFEASEVNLTDLAQVIEGGGLFTEGKTILIEQFVTKKKKQADFKDIISYLESHAQDHTIVLWEGKELDIGSLKTFKQPVIKAYKLPQTLFQFLDAFKPNNGTYLSKLFHQTIETTETEMVFFMIIRQFRLMIALHPDNDAKSDTQAPIDEVKKMTWQRNKLEKQAKAFELETLLVHYRTLYAIESKQKVGKLPAPIATMIDFFLLSV